MAHLPLRLPDDDLVPLLRKASSEDLGLLVECIHRDRNENLSSVPAFLEQNPRAKDHVYDGDHRKYADEIAAEVQCYSGNTVSNIFRGGRGVPYRDVVRDVADHLKVNYHKDAEVARIEHEIQLKLLERAYQKMSDEERADFLKEIGVSDLSKSRPKALPLMAVQTAITLGGPASYKVALIIANGVAKALIGRGLRFGANLALTRAVGAFAGPVGWAVTAGWTLYDLGGPAYRVLIPCIAHISYLRKKLCTCQNCHEIRPADVIFCGTCGTRIESVQMPAQDQAQPQPSE